MRGDMRFEMGALRMNEMDLSNMVADLTMVDDLIKVEQFTTGVYGGTVVADGSRCGWGPMPAQRPFVAKVAGAAGWTWPQALATRAPKKVMTGKFDGHWTCRAWATRRRS